MLRQWILEESEEILQTNIISGIAKDNCTLSAWKKCQLTTRAKKHLKIGLNQLKKFPAHLLAPSNDKIQKILVSALEPLYAPDAELLQLYGIIFQNMLAANQDAITSMVNECNFPALIIRVSYGPRNSLLNQFVWWKEHSCCRMPSKKWNGACNLLNINWFQLSAWQQQNYFNLDLFCKPERSAIGN